MDRGDIADSVYCVGAALARDLPDKSYKRRLPKKGVPFNELPTEDALRRPDHHEVDVYSFPQMWGSTALGFGGMGGSAMTTAQTTVVICGRNAAVYFGRYLAYVVLKYNEELMVDMKDFDVSACSKAERYGDIHVNNGVNL